MGIVPCFFGDSVFFLNDIGFVGGEGGVFVAILLIILG